MGRKGVIGQLAVVYDPARRAFTVEKAVDFVKTQLFQKLDELAKYLYQKETITGDEFMEILERE